MNPGHRDWGVSVPSLKVPESFVHINSSPSWLSVFQTKDLRKGSLDQVTIDFLTASPEDAGYPVTPLLSKSDNHSEDSCRADEVRFSY